MTKIRFPLFTMLWLTGDIMAKSVMLTKCWRTCAPPVPRGVGVGAVVSASVAGGFFNGKKSYGAGLVKKNEP